MELSDVAHSWKSYTAKEILKVEAASRRLAEAGCERTVWQKEPFDHIVRSAESLARFEEYIRGHAAYRRWDDEEETRRDAAATLISEACEPFERVELRQVLVRAMEEVEGRG